MLLLLFCLHQINCFLSDTEIMVWAWHAHVTPTRHHRYYLLGCFIMIKPLSISHPEVQCTYVHWVTHTHAHTHLPLLLTSWDPHPPSQWVPVRWWSCWRCWRRWWKFRLDPLAQDLVHCLLRLLDSVSISTGLLWSTAKIAHVEDATHYTWHLVDLTGAVFRVSVSCLCLCTMLPSRCAYIMLLCLCLCTMFLYVCAQCFYVYVCAWSFYVYVCA